MAAMTEPLDLQAEVRKTLEAFSSTCDGRTNEEVFNAFIMIAENVLNAAAVMLGADDEDPLVRETSDHPNCDLCRAVECASDAAHMLARVATIAIEASGEKVH